ncbi:NADH dehydrogenase [ubiquinone] 1 beta subcomplex subunit 9 [Colletes gigas]|uniref:NADH dehydrogenase [ubiquinone] 1 beta subcomplex subunit 9 n=1 Tax=Colletes gigas TaxID=935657 RepID=UPI001C9B492C|nr:NADH dehydrogenase [ubiquinone] 1 beta subcomplex subunit 9 [Colletes gigas]
MAQLPSPFITHSRKVCSFYKRVLRCVEDWHPKRTDFRYHAVLMRQRFEENRRIPDARVAKQLLVDGEEELFQAQHWQPKKFTDSVDGIAYNRESFIPDYVLDEWTPMEKAMYPKYFAQREELKKEYEELYYKMFPETSKEPTEKK